MSGILDRKSRIIDYKLTTNGRSQIQNGDIRFEYASVSDKSIVYEKNFEESLSSRFNISQTSNFLPFEVETNHLVNINNEFDLESTFSYRYGNIYNLLNYSAEDQNNISFENVSDSFLSDFCLGTSIKNLSLISNKVYLESSGLSFLEKSRNYLDFDFRNQNFVKDYITVKSYNINEINLPSIVFDKRFKNKTNYKTLVPVDSSGTKIYDNSDFPEIDIEDDYRNIESFYKSFKEKITIKKETKKSDIALEIIDSLNKNSDVLKREYEIRKLTENDNFLFNVYEMDEANKTIEKLGIVSLGSFYDNNSYSVKTMYLVGKFINTKNDNKDINKMYRFKDIEFKDSENTSNAVSNYYSFVCLFTIVVE